MTKPKDSTFEQLMVAKDNEEKKYILYCKTVDKVALLESRFPICRNKLFRYRGKVFCVSCFEDRNGSRCVNIEEVEE